MINLKNTVAQLLLIICGLSSSVFPSYASSFIADSEKDFSLETSLYGWQYGYYNSNGFQLNSNPQWGTFSSSGGIINGGNNPEWIARRWVSNFNGIISLSALMPSTDSNNSDVTFAQKIIVDNQVLLSQDSSSQNGHSIYNLDNIAVNIGSQVDFIFAPSNNWSGQFNLMAKIQASSGLIFLDQYPGIQGGHVALLFNGNVYHAHSQYGVIVQPFNTFIQDHNLSPFDHQFKQLPPFISQTMASYIESQVGKPYLIPSTTNLTPLAQKGWFGEFTNVGLIERAAEEARVNNRQGFIPTHLEQDYRVGISCLSLHCTRLNYDMLQYRIWDFLHHGMPSIPQSLEHQNNTQFDYLQTQGFKELEKTTEETYEYITSIIKDPNNLSLDIPYWAFFLYDENLTLTQYFKPQQFATLINPFQRSSWLQGSFDSVDFILTDPLGRQMGYSQEFGFFNEIPNVLYTGENLVGLPDAMGQIAPLLKPQSSQPATEEKTCNVTPVSQPISYSENQNNSESTNFVSSIFQFFIMDRLPGQYQIKQIGNSRQGSSTIEDGSQTIRTELDLCQTSTTVMENLRPETQSQSVPEPSIILGLLITGTWGLLATSPKVD
ncbi:hypothetical protein [Spirulina subsalsa]|uniref:hypothetical protein n=1 Tax=Spirulina subsalsa TaxID=54311 RepID=UPI0002EF0038|nr:hypothetical protein [Spirulina subsalsa]